MVEPRGKTGCRRSSDAIRVHLRAGRTLADGRRDDLGRREGARHDHSHRSVTNHVIDVIPGGDGAFSIAVAGGDMWVTNFARSDVWRFAGRPWTNSSLSAYARRRSI